MTTGICKLCLSAGVELQDSHLIPKAAYRLIREAQGGKAPIIVRNVTMKKDEQVRGYVFCKTCEDRFAKNGEDWVLRNCNRPGKGFVLHDALRKTQPKYDLPLLKVYEAATIPSIDTADLTYFAASIFWRASVHKWKSGNYSVKLPVLDPRYEEMFRKYLLGEGNLPGETTLQLSVFTDPRLWNLILFPYGSQNEYARLFFPFMGMLFVLLLGEHVPPELRGPAFFPTPERLIAMSPKADEMVLSHTVERLGTSTLVGSMKR